MMGTPNKLSRGGLMRLIRLCTEVHQYFYRYQIKIVMCLTNDMFSGLGSDEDEKLTNSNVEKTRSSAAHDHDGRTAHLPVVSRLEVSRTKAKRKRRKSWTGPACRPDTGSGGGSGGGRKGHSLDQGYETTHHQAFASRLHHQHAALYRSFSGGGGSDVGTVVLDGGGDDGGGDGGVGGLNGGVPGTRQFRTPSVVVSDHSEDPVSFSSMFTLDDLDELEPRVDCGFNDSSSDCSAASTWSAAGSVISVLDADYSLHTPERKISGCSTCSTLSGEDEQDAAFRLSKLKPKVSSANAVLFGTVACPGLSIFYPLL